MLGAFYLQSLLHWTLSDSSLEQREAILFHAKRKSYPRPECTLVSCHPCPVTTGQPSQPVRASQRPR